MSKPKPFLPEIWSSEIAQRLSDELIMDKVLRPNLLNPRDVWQPTGETFEEAVAWARLLGVTVTRSRPGQTPGDAFMLTMPPSATGKTSITSVLGVCSPEELIDAIKRHASSHANP